MASTLKRLAKARAAKRRSFPLASRPEVSVRQKGKTPHGTTEVALDPRELEHRMAHPSKGQQMTYERPYKGKRRQGYAKVRY